MVSLADLRRPEYALQWHEAVAVVAEVAAMLMARGLSSVPAPESVILTPDGTLRFLDEGLPDPAPGRSLGDRLGVLLSSVSCPNELRKVAADSVADPPAYPSIAAFAEAIAFFERPARQELLQAIAARSSEVESRARANVELERLQARARNQPDAAAVRASHKRWRIPRAVFVGTGVVVFVGMLAAAILALLANPSRVTIGERVRARVNEFTQQGLEAIGVRTPTRPPPAPVAAPAAEKRSGVAPRPAKRKPREAPLSISLEDLTCECLPPLPALPEPASLSARDQTIYTADAEGVEPAVLLRPHLPREPPSTVPAEEVGLLEIVVGTTGTVEHVRLISTANRFHERMIVAAAKAWIFEPATRLGHPVRYRTHIRVTL